MFARTDVNIRPNDGCSLLHVVSLGGRIDLLNALLQHLDVDTEDNYGSTSLFCAVLTGHNDAV